MNVLTPCLILAVAPVATAADPAALRGIETGDLDRGVEACTDFYQFANGAWRAANPIPASMTRWSRRWQAGEAAKERLKGILDEVSASRSWAPGSVEQLIGDHYASCMDEARIEGLGLAPLKPLLADVDGLRDVAGVQRMIARFHGMAVSVPFGVASSPDNHEPSQVIATVYAAGLGLPDRDYYVKTEPRFQEAREKYRAHVARMVRLAGLGEAEARSAAETVFAMEKALAESSLDNVALRDPTATDHKMNFADLQALTPRIDWAGYFEAARIARADLNVQEPKFMQAVDRALARDLQLLVAEGHAGDIAVGDLGEVEAEPAPARADIQDSQARPHQQ